MDTAGLLSLVAYRIEMLPVWGQYQNCNKICPRSCSGVNDRWVGREAALNLGYPNAGQCTRNSETGNWYSLPTGGQCPQSVVPPIGVCPWRIATVERVKTLDSVCMTCLRHTGCGQHARKSNDREHRLLRHNECLKRHLLQNRM